MASLRGEARNATIPPISAASTIRPIKLPPNSAFSASASLMLSAAARAAISAAVFSVRVAPGWTTVTLTPLGPS